MLQHSFSSFLLQKPKKGLLDAIWTYLLQILNFTRDFSFIFLVDRKSMIFNAYCMPTVLIDLAIERYLRDWLKLS